MGIGFFFQAEDGIRDVAVTGVQTCALPICPRLDAEYHSPDFEDGGPDADRKPGAGMFLRAAREHGVDLARSWWIGDRRRDVEAAGRFGARGFLVCSPETEAEATAGMPFIRPVRSAAQAVDQILSEIQS